jgi:hypothetical protein
LHGFAAAIPDHPAIISVSKAALSFILLLVAMVFLLSSLILKVV